MRKYLACFLVIIAILLVVFGMTKAADVDLRWDKTDGATGYEIQMSADLGNTWSQPRTVTPVDPNSVEVSFTWTGAPDTGLVLFRATAVNACCKTTRTTAGAWYNGSWTPPGEPIGMGIN